MERKALESGAKVSSYRMVHPITVSFEGTRDFTKEQRRNSWEIVVGIKEDAKSTF